MGAHKQVAANCDDNDDDVGDDGDGNYLQRRYTEKKEERGWCGLPWANSRELLSTFAQLCRRRVKRKVLFAARGKHFNRCPTMPACHLLCSFTISYLFFPLSLSVCVAQAPAAVAAQAHYTHLPPLAPPPFDGVSAVTAHGTAQHMTPCTSQSRLRRRRRGRCRSLPAPRAAIRTRTSHVAAPPPPPPAAIPLPVRSLAALNVSVSHARSHIPIIFSHANSYAYSFLHAARTNRIMGRGDDDDDVAATTTA